MSKVITLSVAVVLLVGSSAFGQFTPAANALTQLQNTNIGLGNAVQLLQGQQVAQAIQNLAVQNDQCSTGPCGGLAGQTFFANIAEIGNASGECATVGVLQTLSALGSQNQVVGIGVGPKMSTQTLALVADQGLIKANGAGAGSALHQMVISEDQTAVNSAGVMTESSTILGLQSSNLGGAATATGAVDSTMSVTTVQAQAAM